MTRALCTVAFVCALALSISAADAKPRHQTPRHDSQALTYCDGDASYRSVCPGLETRATAGRPGRAAPASGDPRPSRWCGWWLRQYLGVSDRAGNLARWWARYGANAHGPAVGAIVVWRHHVGIITGRTDEEWIVKSGNDGRAVRERPRSVAGAIAFRWPNGMASR